MRPERLRETLMVARDSSGDTDFSRLVNLDGARPNKYRQVPTSGHESGGILVVRVISAKTIPQSDERFYPGAPNVFSWP